MCFVDTTNKIVSQLYFCYSSARTALADPDVQEICNKNKSNAATRIALPTAKRNQGIDNGIELKNSDYHARKVTSIY